MEQETALALREDEPRNPFVERDEEVSALADTESARAIAEVQAALVIAKRFSRDQAAAMELILQDCGLPALAEAATYDYKKAGTAITGPTIRLAEAIARRWGNLDCGVLEIGRHNGYSECLAYAWDLETNYKERRIFQVRHWRDTRQGGYQLTDEREIYELVANMGARRKRACILAVIPPDVIDNAVLQCEKTMRMKITVTAELIASLLEKFAKHHITREMIEARVQRRFVLENVTPAMVVQLGKIYNSLEEGSSVVGDWFKVEQLATETTKSGRKKPAAKKEEAPDLNQSANQQVNQQVNQSPHQSPHQSPPLVTPATPTPAPDLTKLASADDVAMVRRKMEIGAITEAEVCKAFQMPKLAEMRAAIVPAVLRWLSDPASKPFADA